MTRLPSLSRYRTPAVAVGAIAVLGLAGLLVPPAQSQMPQVRANPVVQPVGVSSSGNGSTAWFHDPSAGRAIACHLPAGGSIQCQVAKLPEGT
jgi:hypothetical protein